MEDILIIEYLKNKGMISDKEYHDIKVRNTSPSHHIESHYDETHAGQDDYDDFFKSFKKITKDMKDAEKDRFLDTLKDYNNKNGDHFNESLAKYTVSNMWHTMPDGEKCMGEVFSYSKAKEIHSMYKSTLPDNISCWDIYVAINAQYHDYSTLFMRWFGSDVDTPIIESALAFWFEDDDYNQGFKLWNYFNR